MTAPVHELLSCDSLVEVWSHRLVHLHLLKFEHIRKLSENWLI